MREEMRRVLEFLEWRASWWEQRSERRTVTDRGVSEGLRAYGLRQAALQRALATDFSLTWQQPLQEAEHESSFLGNDDEDEDGLDCENENENEQDEDEYEQDED